MDIKKFHIVVVGDLKQMEEYSIEAALCRHSPAYCNDVSARTRITMLIPYRAAADEFMFDYQEIFDHSYRRIIDLTSTPPYLETLRPKGEDFVDVEWEFVIAGLADRRVQEKLNLWSHDPYQKLIIGICYQDRERNERIAEKLRRRLPSSVRIEIFPTPEEAAKKREEYMKMAPYVNYVYQQLFAGEPIPNELPEEEVMRSWNLLDEKMKQSNLYNVMSIPGKMGLLGHDPDDWDTYYGMTTEEIEMLTEIEHNRWCVERLILGYRPCTEQERIEVERDMHSRLNDPEYAIAHPESLKSRYKKERKAHFDLCSFRKLGIDESGQSVVRYDRDLTAAIPLIATTYRRNHG